MSVDQLATTGLRRAALDAMPDISVIVFDTDLRIAAIYGGAVREHGHVPEALIGKLLPEVSPPQLWELVGSLYLRVLQGEPASTQLPSSDGTAVFALELKPIVIDGAIAGGFASLRSVTALLEAEQRLADAVRTVRQFTEILDHSPFAVDLRDTTGRWVTANERYHAVYGLEPGELVGKHLTEVLPAESAERFAAFDALVLSSEAVQEADGRFTDPDTGEERRRWVLRFPVRDETGQIVGVGGISMDVSDRERERRELAAARQLFEAAFDNAPVGQLISRVGQDGIGSIVNCNPAIATMLGRSADDILGRSSVELVSEQDRDQQRALLAAADAEGASTGELRLRHGSGHDLWAQVSISTATDADGAALRVVQAIDVTDRRQTEDHLRHIADHDALTGIRGRRAFEQHLADCVRGVRTQGHTAALLLIDLNGFKAINDALGHHAGDEILIRVATALQDAVRPDDLVARLGGDEFAVLLPHTGDDGAQAVAAKLGTVIARDGVTHGPDGRPAGVTAAIGVAVLTPELGLTPEEALRHADAAMYKIKADRHTLDDPRRVAAVHATGLVGAKSGAELQRLVDTLAESVSAPIALISLLTDDEQHFVAQTGLDAEMVEAGQQPASDSFCQYPAATGRPMIVPDTHVDPLLADHIATTDMGLSSYAGLPLSVDGETVGVICVAGTEPRDWTADQQAALRLAAAHTTRYLADRAAEATGA